MGVNAVQFDRELRDELKAAEKKFVVWRADLVGDMLATATDLSPRKTGKLKKRWGAAIKGRPQAFSGSRAARLLLRGAKRGATILAGNSQFYASWIENGTKRGVRARHMLARGIEAVKGRRA